MSLLKLDPAGKIIDAALSKGRELKLRALAVVVLDEAGHIKAVKREGGASMLRVDIAHGKARGAVAMGCSNRAVANRAKQSQSFFVTLAATAGGKFLAQQDGVLVRSPAGNVLGTVGIGGASGDEEEACGAHGVEQAGLTSDIAA